MDGISRINIREEERNGLYIDNAQTENVVTRPKDALKEVTGPHVQSDDTDVEATKLKKGSSSQVYQFPSFKPAAIEGKDERHSTAVQTATQNLVSALEKRRSPGTRLTDSGRTSPAQSMPLPNGRSRLPRSSDSHEQRNLDLEKTPPSATGPWNVPATSVRQKSPHQRTMSSDMDEYHQNLIHSNSGREPLSNNRSQSIVGTIVEDECAQSVEDDEIPQAIIDAQSYGRVPAYAKLVFPDGLYYMTTLYLTLGRDVLALKAAQEHYGDHSRTNSRGADRDRSRPANSLVSLEGGINGCDHDHGSDERGNAINNSHSSSSSGPGTVAPQQLQRKKPFDYEKRIKLAEEALPARKREAPKTVDTQSLLPNHNERPLLPIHPRADLDGAEEIAGHKAISRRHLQIGWNDDMGRFESECLGVNGYYLNSQFRPQGSVDPLDSNALIEIGGIDIYWELPKELLPEHEAISDVDSAYADNVISDGELQSANEAIESIEPPDESVTAKRKAKQFARKESMAQAANVAATPAQSGQPQKRPRGRPPKGEYPQRVLAELKRKEKAAKAREGNGGVTPPPKAPKRPVGRPRLNKEGKDEQTPTSKPEKRKYTKRKHGEIDDGLETTVTRETADGEDGPVEDAKQVKKQLDVLTAGLPDLDTYTDEQKEKPKLPYKHLIYQEFVKDPTPKNLTSIYAALLSTWPHYRTLDGNGWQSSVRHNLIGEKEVFEGVETEGRGKLWKLKEGAVLEPAAKKRFSPPGLSTAPKPRGSLGMPNGTTRSLNGYMSRPPQQYPSNASNGVYGMPPGGQYPPPGALSGGISSNGALGHQMPHTGGTSAQSQYPFPPHSTSTNNQPQGFSPHPPNGYQKPSTHVNRLANGHTPSHGPTNGSQFSPPQNPNEPPQQLVKFVAAFQVGLLKQASPNQREETEALFDAARAIVLHGQKADTSRFTAEHFEAVISQVRDVAKRYGWLDGKKWSALTTEAAVGDGAHDTGKTGAPEAGDGGEANGNQKANGAPVGNKEVES